jgi:hypothetical protein
LVEDEENSFWKRARELDVQNKLRVLGDNIAIQGEPMGEGIQGNKLKLKGQIIYVFNIDKYEYLVYQQFVDFMKNLGLSIVILQSTEYERENDINATVKRSMIKNEIFKEVWDEGVVIRPKKEFNDLLLLEIASNSSVSF